jgi:hypothetical protein
VGQADSSPEEEEVKDVGGRSTDGRSTSARGNGQAVKSRSKAQSKGKWSGVGLRRLTKRQKDKIRRIVTMVILVVFALSIVGGLVAITVKAPGTGH